jgi:hypothetical protein
MAATPQTQALAIVNGMISLGQQIWNLQQAASALETQWSELTIGNILAAWPTVAVNADGSLGAADGTPNEAHLIDPSKIDITRALAPSDITSLVTFIGAFLNLASGAVVAQQGQAPQLLPKLING